MMRKLLSITLLVIGPIPLLIWIFYVIYMFYIGPKIGWISDRFFAIEVQSLVCLGCAFIGILVFALGVEMYPEEKEAKV